MGSGAPSPLELIEHCVECRLRTFRTSCAAAARRVRALPRYDWASTSLGPIAQWPPSLRTAVGLVVHSAVPLVMLWGEDGFMIYNDAYSVFAGRRHPQLLGSKVREGWPEVADFNDNVMKVGLSGRTLAYRDQKLTLYRNGVPEPVWMNLDYSPVLDESGRPAGVIAIVVETTKRVQADQRIAAEQDRLLSLFDQAPGFMAMIDGPERVFTLANPGLSAADRPSPRDRPAAPRRACRNCRGRDFTRSSTIATAAASRSSAIR